ncbi:MAG TPA: clostripain-related cysteine peptidase, partial [Roseiflexaceae bacterium]|nr:clostripain-related cysteine peptidase [Roseiflexaceae bacterium]
PRYVAASGTDSGDCSNSAAPCRAIGYAIGQAAAGDTIMIATGIYAENLIVNKDLTFTGASAATTIIDGGGKGRTLEILSGTTISLSNATIRGGRVLGDGGGIRNSGRLTLMRAVVSGNTSFGNGGTTSWGYGGGVANTGTLDISLSTISGNTADAGGGGILNCGTLSVGSSTIRDNTATGVSGYGTGGGLHNCPGKTATLTSNTISGNSALWGGGISNEGSTTLDFYDGTIANNTASDFGGGLWNKGLARISSVTISGNTSGIGSSGTVDLGYTILADNRPRGNCEGGGGILGERDGYNLDSDGTCLLNAASDLVNVDVRLGPLQDNGGPTWTQLPQPGSPSWIQPPQPGSPAIDSAGQNCVPVDQRGTPRPHDVNFWGIKNCDMGAVEVQHRPWISPIADQTMLISTSTGTIAFTIGDEAVPAQYLSVSATSSDARLIPFQDNIQLGGSGAQRTLQIIPAAGETGQAIITVTVHDVMTSASASFTLNVVQPASAAPPWLVMLYLTGDDIAPNDSDATSLSEPIQELLGRLPYNPNARVVALYDGNKPGGGDSYLFVRQPSGLEQIIPSAAVWPGFSNELDMGSVATLRGFISWARATYPGSPHTMLSIVDHGGGWAPDLGKPAQPRAKIRALAGGARGMAIDLTTPEGSSLSTRNTGEALAGLGRFDVLFFDACLMGMIESAYEVQPYADHFIAGENLLWSRLPYEAYLGPDTLGANTTPRELASNIVQHYNQPGATNEPFAIAAIDMAKLPDLRGKTNALAESLIAALPGAATKIRNAYTQAQKFDYDASYSVDTTDAYVDLADVARQLLRDENDISLQVDADAQAVVDAVTGGNGAAGAVIARRAVSGTTRFSPQTWSLDGASGLSIYLPLGERDCRPTGELISEGGVKAVAPCAEAPGATTGQPQMEPQLTYYKDASQLAFTRDAPRWAELLVKLDPGTLPRTKAPINAPYPARSLSELYLAMLGR